MRRAIIVSVLFVLIVGASIYSYAMARMTKDRIEHDSVIIEDAITAGEYDRARQYTQDLAAYWTEREPGLAVLMRHSQLDEISRSMMMAESHARNGAYADLSSQIAVIRWQVYHVYRSEVPMPVNIM